MSSSPTEKEHQKTTQSTLQVYFRGIRSGESVNRQHHVSMTLPEVMFDVPDASLVQYTLFVLSGGKRYKDIDEIHIKEEAIGLEVFG